MAGAAVVVTPRQTTAAFRITPAPGARFDGAATVTIRGTALQDGRCAVVSEAAVTLEPPQK